MAIELRHESRRLSAAERENLMLRAQTAWMKANGADGARVPQARMATKTRMEGDVEHLMHFVVLHYGEEVLAVYRVRNDTLALRIMTRPPKGLVRLRRKSVAE